MKQYGNFLYVKEKDFIPVTAGHLTETTLEEMESEGADLANIENIRIFFTPVSKEMLVLQGVPYNAKYRVVIKVDYNDVR